MFRYLNFKQEIDDKMRIAGNTRLLRNLFNRNLPDFDVVHIVFGSKRWFVYHICF